MARGSGTRNMREPAMTVSEVGYNEIRRRNRKRRSCAWNSVAGRGEMGWKYHIRQPSVLTLFQLDPAEITGFGAGLMEQGRQHKIRVIRNAR